MIRGISIITHNISSTTSSSSRRHGVKIFHAGVVFSVFRVWSNVLVLLFVSCCDSHFGIVLVIAGLLVAGMNRTRNYALGVQQ